MSEQLIDLYTEEGRLLPEIPWNEYPRPKLRRNSFFCLNGEWDFCESKVGKLPTEYNEKIIVPFCPQSILSGIHRNIPDDSYIFYRRSFSLPEGFIKSRVILNIGAIDQYAEIYINGKMVCEHIGGYEHFSADITEYLSADNTIIIKAYDRLDERILPYGKQKHNRGGMWYTPVTGIWQTVWIESVPNEYVKRISAKTNDNTVTFTVDGISSGKLTLINDDIAVDITEGKATLELQDIKYWSPESPYIYDIKVENDEDEVYSYFTVRTLEIGKINGIERLLLNRKPYFFNGLLDQGYWSDGIFTPASPESFSKDILFAKECGFNTLRKHIKIEPDIFYYECDRLGMIVFQDMVNNGDYKYFRDTVLPTVGFVKKSDKYIHKDGNTRDAFKKYMRSTVSVLEDFNCICYWTIFNEGWGQFCSDEMYDVLRSIDSDRFIDSTSGWFINSKSDIDSRHIYFRKLKIRSKDRPVVISEFGGYTYKVDGHIFNLSNDYGYGKYKSMAEFEDALVNLYKNEVIPLVKQGLCGAVYTQISDVEDEINGLITYDRMKSKVNTKKLKKLFQDIKI